MRLWENLRETRRASRIVAMAQRTKVASLRDVRRNFVRRFGMLRSRTMTSFTGQTSVVGIHFCLVNIFVAVNAGFITGVYELMVRILADCIGSIVPQIAKCCRDKQLPCGDKRCNHRQQYDNQGDYLLWYPQSLYLHRENLHLSLGNDSPERPKVNPFLSFFSRTQIRKRPQDIELNRNKE